MYQRGMNFRKYLSYVWPQTQKIESDCSGTLELTYYKGKKMLDSKNANYSYGMLQEILAFGISNINLKDAKTVLLLGLGGGCVLELLEPYLLNVTAIEFDEKIIEIAKHNFNVEENDFLKIIHSDAFEFVKTNKSNYDFVIVDLFVDNKVPELFYSEIFCNYLYKQLSFKGSLLFNLGMDNEHNEQITNIIQNFEKLKCNVQTFLKVMNTNTLLIVNKN